MPEKLRFCRNFTFSYVIWICALINWMPLQGQDMADNQHRQLLVKTNELSKNYKQQFDAALRKQLEGVEKSEKKLRKVLALEDSVALQEMHQAFESQKAKWIALLQAPDSALITQYHAPYLTRIDSLRGLINYGRLETTSEIGRTLNNLEAATARLALGKEIEEWIQQRGQQWQQLAESAGGNLQHVLSSWTVWQQQAAIWHQQLHGWQEMLNEPERLEKEMLKQLQKFPAFQKFMQQHGELARLFGVTGTPDNANTSSVQLQGLQTRDGMMQELQNRFGQTFTQNSGMLQQQLQQGIDQVSEIQNPIELAKQQLDGLRNKLPEQLSPAEQEKAALKAQPMKKRFEVGWNMQTNAKMHNFPAMTDVGLHLGYKLTPRTVLGTGVAYRFGLGESWRKIQFTHEGIGIRSYMEWRMVPAQSKWLKDLWLTGAFEMNYFYRIAANVQWRQLAWQKSGLVGLSKHMKFKEKEGKIQFLWDALTTTTDRRAIVIRVQKNF